MFASKANVVCIFELVNIGDLSLTYNLILNKNSNIQFAMKQETKKNKNL